MVCEEIRCGAACRSRRRRSELSIRFVRPAAGSTLWARVDVNSCSRRNVVLTATMWTGESGAEKPVSIAQGTYALPRLSE